jgi:cobalamin biosynthesis Mg chelatase CobN
MVNEEIVGGLKNALERGDSIKRAMMTFFNAGYDKKEIEDAAATLLNYSSETKSITNPPEPESKKAENTEDISTPQIIQKVSKYGEDIKTKQIPKPKEVLPNIKKPIQKDSPSQTMTSKEKAIIIILICLLIFLVGLLLTIFLFRQELIDFISSLVS